MSEKLRPIEPIRLKLMDGEERQFLLSQGAIRRLKNRFEIKSLNELLPREADEVLVPVFFESLLGEKELTEEQFADILPAHEEMTRALVLLLGGSLPDRPPVEASPTPIQ